MRRPSSDEVRRMLTPFQVATSSRIRVVSPETSETWPPMIPAMPEGPSRSHTSAVSASKLRSTPSSVVIFSPSRAGADDQLAARHPVEVEGVQRLRRHQHHVVGDVDRVRDRALPGGVQARPKPERRRSPVTPSNARARETRAELRHLDGDRGDVGDRAPCHPAPHPRPTAAARAGRPGDRVHLARDPVDAEAVERFGSGRAPGPGPSPRRGMRAECPARPDPRTMIPSASSPI